MEIGSFIELQFAKGKEYYGDENNTARLNTGRAAVYHAFRLSGCDAVWLPYYQCDTVRGFLKRKGVSLKFYNIDSGFNPVNLNPGENEAVLLVNYFGVMSNARMQTLASLYKHPIIDNCQAFFAKPVENAFNIYSARKFAGVPDGAYVLGKGAQNFCEEYPQGFSSDTSAFLLERIEYGCEGRAYEHRTLNESRIDSEDIMLMSKLTRTILDSVDYGEIIDKRRENFETAQSLFGGVNRLCLQYCDKNCVPMVYPLVYEDDSLLERLLANGHFQGHWWSYLLDEMPENSFEYYLSRYIIPVTIDQRYGREEIEYIRSIV
ncbi:MAG: hypothetical protein II702_03245 [Clostridia bacterium]|nr:hypothetical protein [Clostridia bacterium]